MSVTVRDTETVLALGKATGSEVEIFGPDGRLLGRFTPAPRPGMTYPEFGMTDEEIDRLANDPNGWVSAADVEARLRQLNGDR